MAVLVPDISVRMASAAGRLWLEFPYNPGLIALVKTLPDRRYHPDQKAWTIPAAALGDLQRLAARSGFGLDLEDQVRRALDLGQENRAELIQLKATVEAEPVDLPTETVLYPYQHGGVRFLLQSLRNFKGALLADDMGLGKTVQALSVVAISPNLKNVLIIVPSTLKFTWATEIEKHYPQLAYTIINGSPEKRRQQWQAGTRVTIAGYDVLVCHCKLERLDEVGCPDLTVRATQWDIVIIDEAPFIKSHTAKRTKNTKKLQRRYSVALSGIPIENRLEELHSIMDFAIPGLLGDYWRSFRPRYCILDPWGGVTGYKNIAEVREKIRPHYLRRLKQDVLKELPEKIMSETLVELSSAEWQIYDAVRAQIKAMIEENPKLKVNNILVEMVRLIQITADARLVDEDIGESTKTSTLKDILAAAGGHRIVAFTQFSQYALLLGEELNAPVIYGGASSEERSRIVADFQAGKHPLLLSTEAGAYGITLTAADIIINLTLPWNPAKLAQRADRLHRIGQQNAVQVVDIIGRRTIDEHIKKIIYRKRQLASQIFEGVADDLVEQSLDRNDMLALLGDSG